METDSRYRHQHLCGSGSDGFSLVLGLARSKQNHERTIPGNRAVSTHASPMLHLAVHCTCPRARIDVTGPPDLAALALALVSRIDDHAVRPPGSCAELAWLSHALLHVSGGPRHVQFLRGRRMAQNVLDAALVAGGWNQPATRELFCDVRSLPVSPLLPVVQSPWPGTLDALADPRIAEQIDTLVCILRLAVLEERRRMDLGAATNLVGPRQAPSASASGLEMVGPPASLV